MAQILSGAEVVTKLNECSSATVDELKACGVIPQLAIVRVGAREDEISYERGAVKRAENVGVATKKVSLPDDTSQEALIKAIEALNADETVHGVLLLRPLPAHIDDDAVRNTLDPKKDVDGITDAVAADIFTSRQGSFVPCTPHACMDLLDYYGIALEGKTAVVVGRSLVVGKPLAMMLLDRNATVTIAHSRTVDLASVVRSADIVIVCTGHAKMVGAEYLRCGQVVIDVGINALEDGSLVGDVDFEAAQAIVSAITPIPGGVGAVTTSVLVKHVIQAAKLSLNKES
jgi:methylenetetrahydrofolate dehydrogenase (NADP+)/methenyltetrahydrofolate cyclohydrolase